MSTLMNTNRQRLRLLDAYRGLTILSMMLFHACWDLCYFKMGITSEMMNSTGAYIWQQSICYSFILLAGYCFLMGRHQLKRGLMAFGGGLIITLITVAFTYDSRVVFGVLSMLGTSIILTVAVDKILPEKMSRKGIVIALFVVILLFLISRNINRGYLGFEGINICKLPDKLYTCGYAMTFIGFKHKGFYSTDYFSIIPWYFLFLTGYLLKRLMDGSRFEKILENYGCKPLELLGRHSLLIYMLHQVIIYGIIYGLSMILPKSGV